MAAVSGSSEAAADLQGKVRGTAGALVQLQADFKKDLDVLRMSARDDSLSQAEYYHAQIDQKLRDVLPQMAEVNRRLNDYVRFIEKIDLGIGGAASSAAAGRQSFVKSGQTWKVTDESVIYDDPEQTGKNMIHRQTRGHCGICAIVNLLTMAGKHMALQTVEDYAKVNGLCDGDGGTSCSGRERILGALGFSSHPEEQTIEGIAAAVASGRGVIISVNSAKLSPYGYNGWLCFRFEPHALLVTSVITDRSGKVTHIVVCDSNSDSLGLTGAVTYPVKELKKALIRRRKMNVTDDPVR